MLPATISLHSPAPDDKTRELHERLAEAGQALRDDEFETFVLAVDAENGEMAAGCKGEIVFDSVHVSELWVDERYRGQALGSRLLARVEAHAKLRGCARVHLETRSEAARTLYEKLGYSVFGKLTDYDGDTPLYYLEKRIR